MKIIKDEALKLALEALEHLQPTALTSFYTIGARDKAITAIKQARALDKKAENARELGLDYEPVKKQRWAVFCRVCKKEWSVSYQHPGKSICADCDDAPLAQLADHSEQDLDMVKAQPATVQEPEAVCHDDGHWTPLKTEAGRRFNDLLSKAGSRIHVYTTPPAQPAPVQEHKGCACRWDSEGDRTVTCERHQGWLEVIAEWADRAREAEAKLKEKNA